MQPLCAVRTWPPVLPPGSLPARLRVPFVFVLDLFRLPGLSSLSATAFRLPAPFATFLGVGAFAAFLRWDSGRSLESESALSETDGVSSSPSSSSLLTALERLSFELAAAAAARPDLLGAAPSPCAPF